MRNLRCAHRWVAGSYSRLPITAIAWDDGNDSVILTTGPTKENDLIQLQRWKTAEDSDSDAIAHDSQLITSWNAPPPSPSNDCDQIVSLHCMSENSSICVVLKGGDIIIIRELPHSEEEKIEIVGTVDAGISAAAWSPDGELLAIVTLADTLLYMTRDFENIVDVTFGVTDLELSKQVSVGWGREETQFKGKGAKLLRDPTVPEKMDEGLPSPYDDGCCTISWRGDGVFLAVNSLQPGKRRVIRVFSREGALDSVSEPVDGLDSALSWRPAGNLIAGIQRHEDQVIVVFFERNGLRHGQFDLRLTKDEISIPGNHIALRWNVDSSVLAVRLPNRVQLWTMGNYHYYLKQDIFLYAGKELQEPSLLVWHPEQNLTFAASSNCDLQRFDYAYHVAASEPVSPHDYGIVAVIDGQKLKLTPLRTANIPPPMALYELSLASSIIDVAVSSPKASRAHACIAVLLPEQIQIYEWNVAEQKTQSPLLRTTLSLDESSKLTQSDRKLLNLQVIFLGHDHLLILQSHETHNVAFIYKTERDSLLLVNSTKQSIAHQFLNDISRTDPLLYTRTLFPNVQVAQILYSDADLVNWQKKTVIASFPKSTQNVALVTLEETHLANGSSSLTGVSTLAFGLTLGGSLFAGNRCITKNCTSFFLTPSYLIFTTSQHLLKFVHLTIIENLEVPLDTPELDERCRSIERGARIVTVIPSIFAVVLQMPRGNLETIYPRALVLAGIRRKLDQRKYKKAFLACRSQRVDMNIIHDHRPDEFIANVGLFVDQVVKVEHIDLFLSQLREEDVSKTMYKETGISGVLDAPLPNIENSSDTTTRELSKVNRLCNAFLTALKSRASANLQNIISAHVCKNPPDLEAGLSVVASLQRDHPAKAELAVEHICFLADVNKLYDTALGLYDLQLTLLVAQQSQKDPREYLPFLQNLHGMSTLQRQFNIDNYLARYSKALGHLHETGVFEDFKSYTIKHNMYEIAIHICRYQEEGVKSIMKPYADYLHKESKFREAGIAFEYLKDYASAAKCYHLAHLWRESLSAAILASFEESALKALAEKLAETLIQLKDYQSAAAIHIDYLHDIDVAARILCQGYWFSEAARVLVLHRLPASLELVVDTGLTEGMASMTEFLAECKVQLSAQVLRLRELRIKKAEQPLAFYDGSANNGADIPDNVSLAATDASTAGGSLFTRYTNRTGTVGTNATRKTSKNKMREERKRARGKKGSVYEEEYLVNSIGRLIDRLNATSDELKRLVEGLARRGMRERAKAVETSVIELIALCRNCVEEVFQTNKVVVGDKVAKDGDTADRPSGADGLLWDSIEEVQIRRDPPMVKDFEKVSILGS